MIRIGPVSIALSGWMALSLSFAMLLPSAAQAESGARGKCLYLDVTGPWIAYQSNMPNISIQFDLQQTGPQFHGTAYYLPRYLALVVGTVTGSSLKMTADWNGYNPFKGEPIGEYTGAMEYGWLGENVGMHGTTVEMNPKPETVQMSATWFTNRRFPCGTWQPEPSAITPPAGIALGRVNPPPGTAPGPPRPICDVAAEARARNSPAAPALEAQCHAAKSAEPVKALDVYEKVGREKATRAYALIPGHIGGASVSQSSRGHVLTVEGSGKCGLKVFEELDGKAVEIYDYKGPLPTTIRMVNTLPGMHVAKLEGDKSSEGCDGTASASFPMATPGRNSRRGAR